MKKRLKELTKLETMPKPCYTNFLRSLLTGSKVSKITYNITSFLEPCATSKPQGSDTGRERLKH